VKDWDDLFKLYKQIKTLASRHLQQLQGDYPDVEKVWTRDCI
jgi:hypothetical protein